MGSRVGSDISSHQTVRLGPGRHSGPGAEVCVMELSSMLSGERFSDRPASVCPIVAALLRAYNDNVDQRRRQTLYGYAAEVVGTRGDFGLQLRRARSALRWAQGRYAQRRRFFSSVPRPPRPDDGPDKIALYVLRSLGRHSNETHRAVFMLLDQLIDIGADQTEIVASPMLGREVGIRGSKGVPRPSGLWNQIEPAQPGETVVIKSALNQTLMGSHRGC